ncbi:MAG: hypothetical protein ACYC8V_07575 [Caulobacteraceae bacterium]
MPEPFHPSYWLFAHVGLIVRAAAGLAVGIVAVFVIAKRRRR